MLFIYKKNIFIAYYTKEKLLYVYCVIVLIIHIQSIYKHIYNIFNTFYE